MTSSEKKSLRYIVYTVSNLMDLVATIKDDCEERYNNLTWQQQESERGERMGLEVEKLEAIFEAMTDLDYSLTDLDEQIGFLG